MADLVAAAAAAAAANDDDVDDLYADLDDQVAAALAAAGESGGSNARDSDPATDAEGEVPGADAKAGANEAVDLGDGPAGYSSSDEESEDDLHIVLNEDGGAPLPPPACRCEEGWVEGSEEGEVSGSLVKGPSINEGGRGKLGRLHCKGLLDKTTVPITGQGDRGHQHAFQKDFYFFLPRNRTVFDINIEAFQQKPWRQHGVDLADYFNFGLDEEGWRKYCFGMKQFRQGARSLAKESSGLDQESHYNRESFKLMPKLGTYSGFDERNDLAKPKGRAIHVEGGVCERLPSADMWRPRQRDSDVVIQVNMMLSPSNHSTSDDSSTVNYKCMTTESENRISMNNPDKCVKDISCVVDRVVDKEVHNGGSSECTGNKLDIRDSACTRDRSSSPDYSDMLSEESTEDCYFKRAHRHPNSNAFYADTKLKDVHVKSDFCHHSSKSDRQSSKGDSHSYTPSPTDDRYHKASKLLRTDVPPFASSEFFINCRNDRRLLKSGHKATREQKRKSSAGGRHAVFEKQEKLTDSYPSRYPRKYGQKRSSSTSLSNNYHNTVHNQVCEKKDYSPLERVALRNDAECFSDDSNHQRRRSSWHEINDCEDVVSSVKEWQQCRDHGYGYNSMLKAELSDDIDGRMYRERYYQEMRRVRHGHSEDDKIFHYTDYRFDKLHAPEVRGKYRDRRRAAESNDEHLRHPDHLVLSPRANDYLKNSERDWPTAGLTFMSSRNRCIDNKRIHNAKMMQYYRDGDYQKNKRRDSSLCVGDIRQSALYTAAAAAETGYSILPVKRQLHAGLASMNRKDLVGLSFPKGRRLMHDQSMISDRKLYAAEVHNFSKEIDGEAICTFNDMRNSNTISNIYDERRHELVNLQPKDTDSIHLNDRKRKFKRQGNVIRREVESGNEGRLPTDKDLRSSKHKDVHQKVRKLNRSYHHSGNQDLEKSAYQKLQNIVSVNEEDEIEEGELIEQDCQDTVSKSHLNKPRKAVLKSVIEASSAGQLGVINAMSKDAVCNEGATRECDNKRILEVMEKMQKRRERFKEPVTQKEEDDGRKELLAVACSADDTKNQRPARKRRWGGSG